MAIARGTQAAVIVTSEGIVMAADSRDNLSNGQVSDGHRKIVLFPDMPNLAFLTTGTVKWLPEGVTTYTGEEKGDIDVKELLASFIGEKIPTQVDEAYLNELGDYLSSALVSYFSVWPRRWVEWVEPRDDGTQQPSWFKIMIAQQCESSIVATIRVMRGDVFPTVNHCHKIDRISYRIRTMPFIVSGYWEQERARPILAQLLMAVPGIRDQPLTAEAAAGVARAFIGQAALVSPVVGGRIDAVLISSNAPPRELA